MWQLADKRLTNRLLLGTAQYPSLQTLAEAVKAAQIEVLTVALRRCLSPENLWSGEAFWKTLEALGCQLLPNTAGCRTAQEAITTAECARELFQTHWIKLEVIGDDGTLQPDPFELLEAARILLDKGFEVFPYCTEDLIVCQRLLDCGCRILMPWAAPIGTGKGVLNPEGLKTLRARLPDTILIVDAGLRSPSQAAQVMEWGFDGVLINTAIANATQPAPMACAFRDAVKAGRQAFTAGLMSVREMAHSSTSLLDTPFWQQDRQTGSEH